NDAEILAHDKPVQAKRLELAAEHAGRDFTAALCPAQQTASDLAVAPRSVLEIPHDAELVLPADHLLKRGDRAAAGHLRTRHRVGARTLVAQPIIGHGEWSRHSIVFVHTC